MKLVSVPITPCISACFYKWPKAQCKFMLKVLNKIMVVLVSVFITCHLYIFSHHLSL